VSKFDELLSNNLGVYAVKTPTFAAIRPQFDDDLQCLTLAFRKGLKDRNFDFSGVMGNHLCSSRRNLVRFNSVTPEFKT